MTMLQIQVEDSLLATARREAEARGTTVETLLAELIAQKFRSPSSQSPENWVKDFLAATEHPKGDSQGWKWNRDELYDE